MTTSNRGQSATGSVGDSSLAHPGQPTNISITRYSDSSLEIFWDRQAANVRYQIFRNGEFLAFAPGPSFFDESVNAGTTYHYTIVAQQTNGDVFGVGFVNEPAIDIQ